MVKRAFAIVVGVMIGAVVGYGLRELVVFLQPEADEGAETCDVNAMADCVRYEAPARMPAPVIAAVPETQRAVAAAPVAASCKDWLSGGDVSAAALSQCLHAARSGAKRPIGRSI